MTKPFPCCCKCWSCATKPVSVEILANVVSGDNCCNHPNGTYSVGGASNDVFDSSNLYAFGLRTNGFTLQSSVQPCTWSWIFKQNKSSTCASGTVTDYDNTSGVADYIAKCMTTEFDGFGIFFVVEEKLNIGIKWANKYSAADPGRRVSVEINRFYRSYYCAPASFTSPWTLNVTDHYDSGVVTCDALPSTINYLNRQKTLAGVNVTTAGDTYTWGGYSYSLCPKIDYVTVNYAA